MRTDLTLPLTCTECGKSTMGEVRRWRAGYHEADIIECGECLRTDRWWNWCKYSHCKRCSRRIYYRGRMQMPWRYCSSECQQLTHDKVKERKWQASQDARMKLCTTCDQQFTPPRNDAKYCSPACRQRAYRQRGNQASLPLGSWACPDAIMPSKCACVSSSPSLPSSPYQTSWHCLSQSLEYTSC